MRVKIEITCDNDAFFDDATQEVSRILVDLAKRINGHPHFSPGHDQCLMDVNGNEVGFCGVYSSRKKRKK